MSASERYSLQRDFRLFVESLKPRVLWIPLRGGGKAFFTKANEPYPHWWSAEWIEVVW